MILTVPDDGSKLWPTLGDQVCRWIEENLVFGPGDLRGNPAILDEEKRAFIYRMYEIYPRRHEFAGRRRFKRCALSLPKGLGKTEFGAWIAACELHPDAPVRFNGWEKGGKLKPGRGVKDPYIPLVAYTEEQSDELAYGALLAIREEAPVKNDFDIGLDRIVRVKGDGKAVSLATNPSARDGARTTFCIFDETHHFTLPRLKQAHQTMLNNMGKRKLSDPWTLEITTAPEPGSGSVAEATWEYGQAVADGLVKDASLFFFHRQASDNHDLETEQGARAAVIEASGAAASWRDIEAIVSLWKDPTTDRQYWERVWCNRLVKAAHKAFDPLKWKALASPFSLAAQSLTLRGDLVALGFDGSIRFDSTGLVATHIRTGFQWVVGAWERPYHAPDSWTVPAEEVDETLRSFFKAHNVFRLYADPPYWQDWIAKWAGEFGETRVIEWWTNHRKKMTYALEAFQSAIEEKRISHDGNEALARHVANAYKANTKMLDETTKQPLWLIQKERPDSPNKIDLCMAAVLSWQARNDAVTLGLLETKRNYYEDHAPVFVR